MKAKFGISLSTRAILFDWGSMDDILDMAVTAEDIQKAAAEYYDHDRRVVLYFMNENAQ